jgi:hypothetical protein
MPNNFVVVRNTIGGRVPTVTGGANPVATTRKVESDSEVVGTARTQEEAEALAKKALANLGPYAPLNLISTTVAYDPQHRVRTANSDFLPAGVERRVTFHGNGEIDRK